MTVRCGKCGNHLTTAQLSPGPQGPQCAYCGATVPVFDQQTMVTPGPAAAGPSVPPAGLQIEGYDVLGRLGEGGMGIVYLARQVSLKRKVAVKVLASTFVQDASFLARFDREIAALVCLSHPHIVTIFDRGRTADGQVYYVMEYVEGEAGGAPLDLDRLIAEGRLDSQRTRELMLQVVQALGFAHREGIIPRDVKPSNILIDRHGFAKVADFGIACMRDDQPARQVTMANAAVGTAIYASPEQQRDAASVDHRSDIYAAGIMLYQMLTGNLPLAGYSPPSIAVAGLNSRWDGIVAKAVQPRPEDRFRDMAEFEAELRAISSTVVAQPMPAPGPHAAPPRSTAGGSLTMGCPQCGSPACEADQFCVTCGVPLWNDCRQCGTKVFATARFCPGCRADLASQRAFEDYFRHGQDHFEAAKRQPACMDAVRHLEQARLALTQALTCMDSPEARASADQINRLTVSVAWNVGEAAKQANHLTDASYCYGQIIEADPRHTAATGALKKIRSYRSDLLGKARTLFAAGHGNNALALLRTGVEQFEDDAELAELYAQYHESSVQLQQLQSRIPALAAQNRWCEVAQVVAELSQSGVAMKGLDAESAKARQRLAAVDPLMTAARRALEAGHADQAVAQANQVLQHVADHAEAMEIIERVRSRDLVAQRRAAVKRGRRRVLIGVVSLACLTLVSGLAYVYVTEAQTIGRAEQQVKAGDYTAGTQTLSSRPQWHFHLNEARYLDRAARLKQYACAKQTPKAALLQASRTGFLELFGANEGWRTRARVDVADTIDRVPPDAPDALARSLAVAELLEELQVAEPAALAAGLVAKVKQRAQAGLPALGTSDGAYILRILEWDPAVADQVVELACPVAQPLAAGLATVRSWAAAGPQFAAEYSTALIGIADREAARGAFQDATLALDMAKRIDAKCNPEAFWEKRFQQQVERGDARTAVSLLSYMVQGEQDTSSLTRAVKLYQGLKAKFPQSVPPPPAQIAPEVSRTDFGSLMEQVEQAMKKRECSEVLRMLAAAQQQYPELFQQHARARELYGEATFTVGLDRARGLLASGSLDAAEKAVDEALIVRADDADGRALRDEIRKHLAANLAEEGRALLDAQDWSKAIEHLQVALERLPNDSQLLALSEEATAHQHRIAGQQALERGDLRAAVEAIVAGRALLNGRSNASWSGPVRQAVDSLAAGVRDRACDQAQKLAGQREYDEALQSLEIASTLSSSDPKVLTLREQIEGLRKGAKTADLSGTWRAPPGLFAPNGVQLAPEMMAFELADKGTEISVKALIPPGTERDSPLPSYGAPGYGRSAGKVRDVTGQWRRDGTRLVGTFDFVLPDQQIAIRATVSANVKDSRTLAVEWRQIRYTDVRKKEFKLEGFVDWTRAE